MNKILELRRKMGKLVGDARKLLDGAKDGKLATEDEQRYNAMMDDVTSLKSELQREERLAELETEVSKIENPEGGKPAPEAGEGERAAPHATKEYRQAFGSWLRTGNVTKELRDLQADVDTKGGFLLAPQQMVMELIKAVDDQVVIAALATVHTLAQSSSLGAPTLDADPSDSDWTTELGTGSEDSAMKFGKRELKPHPLAKRIKVSNKLLRLASQGAEALVRERLGYKFAVTAEKAYMTGNGAGKPLGLFTASADGINTDRDVSTGNTTTGIGEDNLLEVKYALKAQYWARARWLFSREAVKQIAKLKDNDGKFLWEQSMQAGQPDRLLGFPVLMSEFVPNTFTASKYVGMFGDFSAYWIARSMDLEIQRLVELYAEKNQTGFIGRLEGDGMPVLGEPFVRIQLAAS